MTSPLHNQIEQMMADFERHKTAVGAFQRDIAAAETTISPKNRSISVTVDGRGDLVAVRFPNSSYRTMPAAELGKLIVDTVGEARTEAREKAVGIFGALMPAGMPVADMLRGPVDFDQTMEQISEVIRDLRGTPTASGTEDGPA